MSIYNTGSEAERDDELDALRAERDALRDWQRRAVEQLREARDDVVEASNRTYKPHTMAFYRDQIASIDALLAEATHE